MTRVYSVYRQIACNLIGCGCGELIQDGKYTPPDCKNCETYIEWKKLGMTIEEYMDSQTDELL